MTLGQFGRAIAKRFGREPSWQRGDCLTFAVGLWSGLRAQGQRVRLVSLVADGQPKHVAVLHLLGNMYLDSRGTHYVGDMEEHWEDDPGVDEVTTRNFDSPKKLSNWLKKRLWDTKYTIYFDPKTARKIEAWVKKTLRAKA